jgi:hypothetical protein
MEFGVATQGNAATGVLGIGYPALEGISQVEGLSPYPNLVDVMLSQGLIESRTYSLYLNGIHNSEGSIVFGGLDLDKFTGSLYTLPINAGPSGVDRFYVTLTSITLSTSSSATPSPMYPSGAFPVNAVLDSGTSFMVFPSDIYQTVLNTFHAESVSSPDALPVVNCNMPLDTSVSLNFYFSDVEIQVPYNEFILESSTGVCYLAIQESLTVCAVLGDAFLRSAYVVYDLARSSSRRPANE